MERNYNAFSLVAPFRENALWVIVKGKCSCINSHVNSHVILYNFT